MGCVTEMNPFQLIYRDAAGVMRRRPGCPYCSLVSGHGGWHYIVRHCEDCPTRPHSIAFTDMRRRRFEELKPVAGL